MLIAWLRFQALDTGASSGWVVQNAGWFPGSQNIESDARTAVAEVHVCLEIVTQCRSAWDVCKLGGRNAEYEAPI